jgi:hypothetical protein
MTMPYGELEREDINKLRVAMNMRVNEWKDRKCMMCGERFRVWGFAAYCECCKAKAKEITDEVE